MKKLDLDTYGVNEMDAQEVLMFDGGTGNLDYPSVQDEVKELENILKGIIH